MFKFWNGAMMWAFLQDTIAFNARFIIFYQLSVVTGFVWHLLDFSIILYRVQLGLWRVAPDLQNSQAVTPQKWQIPGLVWLPSRLFCGWSDKERILSEPFQSISPNSTFSVPSALWCNIFNMTSKLWPQDIVVCENLLVLYQNIKSRWICTSCISGEPLPLRLVPSSAAMRHALPVFAAATLLMIASTATAKDVDAEGILSRTSPKMERNSKDICIFFFRSEKWEARMEWIRRGRLWEALLRGDGNWKLAWSLWCLESINFWHLWLMISIDQDQGPSQLGS